MGRSWDRYDASLEDIKRCRRAIISQFPNATDIFYDEYLVDRHQNESCNANKFYYGAVMETKDGRFQAATSYGRIGEHLDSRKAFGGIKAFDEGVFTNFDSAKRKLNEKLDKKKRGKRCSKCKTRQSYSPFAPKNAEEYGADSVAESDLDYIKKLTDSFMSKNPTVMGEYGPFGYYKLYEHPVRGQSDFLYFYTPAMGGLLVQSALHHKDQMNDKDAAIVSNNLVKLLKQDNLYHTDSFGDTDQLNTDALYEGTENVYFAEEYGAEAMSPQVFGKLAGQYPQPPNNPLPVGGFMDEGFEWTVNQAEEDEIRYRLEVKYNEGDGWEQVGWIWKNEEEAISAYYDIRLEQPEVRLLEVDEDGDIEEIMSQRNFDLQKEDYYCTKCDEGFSSITPTDEGQFCNNCLPDSATPHNEMDATTQKEEFGSSNIVSKVKNNWLNSLIGLGVGLVAFDLLKKKGYVANADTLIESPNTGDLTPADYEEIVVESTGYAVPIIPVSLDGSFMGSRFHALPTDRYVYDSPEGIGANIDVAMKRNTTFLPNEQSLVQASEAPGQSPYNSMQPNGQENTDFPLRVIHETTTVSLDPSTAPFIPTDLSGYTGQQFVPTSVYEDMLGVGISGRIPSFSQPASGDIGSNHFGSRIANPDMLTNVGGPLKEDVNGDYTDGNITKSLSQWSIENQVQQISDTEAIVVERGSGGRKMIRRV